MIYPLNKLHKVWYNISIEKKERTGLAIDMSKKSEKIKKFRRHVERTYSAVSYYDYGDFGEILCFELHSQPVNSHMERKTCNNGFATGLTFKELADKWGISTEFLGELIADHCKKL